MGAKKKPKFKVGQVVFVKDGIFYGRVVGIERLGRDGYGYGISVDNSTGAADYWRERWLRPLRERERGE